MVECVRIHLGKEMLVAFCHQLYAKCGFLFFFSFLRR